MTAPDLAPTVTAPNFGVDPLGYYVWHLRNHGEMYRAFRLHADLYRAHDPTRRVSADMICHVMRYQSGLGASDDQFRVNNVLTPLYARLYQLERPEANFDIRSSWLDVVEPDDRVLLYEAFAYLREVKSRE